MPAHEVALNELLVKEHFDFIRAKRLILVVNRGGRITCTSRDSGWVGIGKTPRQALDDWLDKLAVFNDGRGSE